MKGMKGIKTDQGPKGKIVQSSGFRVQREKQSGRGGCSLGGKREVGERMKRDSENAKGPHSGNDELRALREIFGL
jgi:hypothetical protein